MTKTIIAVILTVIFFLPQAAEACTSAIVSADMNPYGRPLLWKHRDTNTTDNKVEYIPAKNGEYGYVALFNAKDASLREAWMGMNDVGFAIMNTASYNIKDDKVAKSKMDREGILMSKALKSCRSVEDFARFLESYPRPMGVEANFGVIDAAGNGAYFETNNHSYKRFDLKDAENGVLVRTNYSHSGRPNQGYGFVREANAEHLLAPYIARKEVTPEVLTEVLSRTFYHDKYKKDFSSESENLVLDEDFIPRYKSTATIVIEGCKPVEDIEAVMPGDLTEEYIMWTGMGYPPCSEIIPVWCRPDGVDSSLRGLGPNGHSEMGDIVKARRAEVFSSPNGSKKRYVKMPLLFNDEGTGYVQVLTKKNRETYDRVRKERDGK